MITLYEDRFKNLDSYDFIFYLSEFLNKTDTILDSPSYVTQLIEPYDETKKRLYNTDPRFTEIKKDIKDFVLEWRQSILRLTGVDKVDVNPSPYFGLSCYVYVDLIPTRRRLADFYDENYERYHRVKFRFTDHPEIDYNSNESSGVVDLRNKTFIQASNEMFDKIKTYIDTLRRDETKEINRIKRKEREGID